MSEWISVKDKLPNDTEDGVYFYVAYHGLVVDDCFYSAFYRKKDGYGKECGGGAFYYLKCDSDHGGEFKASEVTYWMEKPPLPSPPKESNDKTT